MPLGTWALCILSTAKQKKNQPQISQISQIDSCRTDLPSQTDTVMTRSTPKIRRAWKANARSQGEAQAEQPRRDICAHRLPAFAVKSCLKR
jgi:hypothetical protein